MSAVLTDEPTLVVRRHGDIPENKSDIRHDVTESYVEEITKDNALELVGYDNKLLSASSDILSVISVIPRLSLPHGIDEFRQKLIEKLNLFRKQATHLDYHPSLVDKSCFVLSAALDEAVLSCSWSAGYQWENNIILSQLFNRRNGGEIFFELLSQTKKMANKLIDLLELQYYLLMLGFKGKYRHYNQSRLVAITAEVYDTIQHYRELRLLPVPAKIEPGIYQKPTRLVKKNTLFLITLGCLFSMGIASEAWYQKRQSNLLMPINQVNQTIFNKEEVLRNSVNYDISSLHSKGYEIVLATLSSQESMSRLIQIVKADGYDNAKLNYTGEYIELIIPGFSTINEVKDMKQKIYKQFNLNGYIRRAQVKEN